MNTAITEANIGKYFIDGNGAIWKLVEVQSQPTAMIESVADRTQVRDTIGADFFSGIRLLVPLE